LDEIPLSSVINITKFDDRTPFGERTFIVPRLSKLGYTNVVFYDKDSDIRIVRCVKDGVTYRFWYGKSS
jgi:hypothetical protein